MGTILVDFVKFYDAMVEELNSKVPNFTTHVLNLGFPQFTNSVTTAAVWGEKRKTEKGKVESFIVFGVNPNWVKTLTPQQFATVCAHETLHRVLGHVTAQGDHESPDLYNMAADLVINDYLTSVLGMEKVPDLLYGEAVVGVDCAWFTVVEVLTMMRAFTTPLVKSCEFLNSTDSTLPTFTFDDFSEENGENGENGESGESTSQENDPSSEEKGNEDNQLVRGNENFTTMDNTDLEELLKGMNPQIYERIREELPENFNSTDSDARAEEEGASGGSPAGSTLSFREMKNLPSGVKLKWKELLEDVAPNLFGGKSNTKYTRSWHTKPRKTAWLDTSLPHVRPEPKGKLNRKHGKPKFVLALDTSSSIPYKIVQQFITLAESIPQDKVDMDVIGFTTSVYPINVNNARTRSGGTNFQAIQDYLMKKYPKYPELVIVITDGGSSFGYNPPTDMQKKSWRWLIAKTYTRDISPFKKSDMLKLSDYVT